MNDASFTAHAGRRLQQRAILPTLSICSNYVAASSAAAKLISSFSTKQQRGGLRTT